MSAHLKTLTLPPVTREQLKAYAKASGDHNPIHMDEEVALKMGLPGVIAHGMLSAAWLANRALECGREVDGGPWRLSELQTRFRAMVVPGDVLTVSVTVSSQAVDRLVLELSASNGKGETVTTSTATLLTALN